MTFIGHIYFVSLNNGADRTIMQCTSNQNRHDIKHVKVAEAEANYQYNKIKYAQISISANFFSSLPNSPTSCQAFEACVSLRGS